MKKRKDKKGNVLRTGESIRKDGRYEYRYTNKAGCRCSVYADSLDQLRAKEKEIYENLASAQVYLNGSTNAIELIDRYLQTKKGVKNTTADAERKTRNALNKESFMHKRIRDIRMSDVKIWFVEMQKNGRKKATLNSYRSLLYPAFQMATEEDVLRKNPFDFKMGSVLVNDAEKREALTDGQVERFLAFCRADCLLYKYVDEFIVLLETGVRVSELCGITKKDLDFDKEEVKINKQLIKIVVDGHFKYVIETTKTSSGDRIIPLTPDAKAAFERILQNRTTPKVEMMINGVDGFILINNKMNPKTAYNIQKEFERAMLRYRKANPSDDLPNVTPHVFRHTFCTRLANKGVDVKALQYLMGHTDVATTLNVYTHKSYEHARREFNEKIKKDNRELDDKGDHNFDHKSETEYDNMRDII